MPRFIRGIHVSAARRSVTGVDPPDKPGDDD